MGGWIALFVLIIGAFFFSFIGVIFLLGKTKRLEESINILRHRIDSLTKKDSTAVSPNITVEPYENIAVMPIVWAETAVAISPAVEAPPENIATPPAETVAAIPSVDNAAPDLTVPPSEQNRLFAAFKSFIRGGNLWAAGGVVLLAAGFGTLIAFLARRGFFTVEMGIGTAVAVGIAMILFGWRFRKKRPGYFLVLQGGGIGILYLAVFAAYRFTPHLGLIPAIILMSLLIPPAVILALFQNSQSLAVLGFLGGFAAPLLLSIGRDNHLFLFSYYAILNGGVFAIGFYRHWKGLNLLAFSFTSFLSLFWATRSYAPEYLSISEPFFLIYFFLFTVLGLKSAKNDDYRFRHYSDIILILGTPAAAAALQWKVFSYVQHGYAIIAAIFSVFYLLLALFIFKKERQAATRYAEAYLALAILLANLVIPLELSPGISVVLWAAEGALLCFIGQKSVGLRSPARNLRKTPEKSALLPYGDTRIIIAGIIVHLAAVFAFIRDISLSAAFLAARRAYGFAEEFGHWQSPSFTGSLIIAVSALAMAILAEKLPPKKEADEKNVLSGNVLSVCMIFWGLAWWFCAWYFEFLRILPTPGNAFLVLASMTGALCWIGITFFGLKFLIAGMVPALFVAALTVLRVYGSWIFNGYYQSGFIFSRNFFESSSFWVWVFFFVLQWFTIIFFRSRVSNEPAWFRDLRIFTTTLVSIAVLSTTSRFYTSEFGLPVLLTSLAGLLPVLAVIFGLPFIRKNEPCEKLLFRGKLCFPVLPIVLSAVLMLWFLITLFYPGNPAPLPCYIPILSHLDILEGLCIAAVLFWQIMEQKNEKSKKVLSWTKLIVLGDIMIFLWIVSILARSMHFYAAIPWRGVAGSDAFHVCLFIFWAVYGVIHIVLGHKKKRRGFWIAGAILVALDIAKLILFDMRGIGAVPRILSFFAAGLILLFIGWAAPLPPTAHRDDE
jgi:uncharacterized membrane protein